MLKDITTLKPKHYLITLITCLSLVGPGFLCIYHYKPELIVSIDIIKLLIFSVSITLPLQIFNFVYIGIVMINVEYPKDDITIEEIWTFGAIVTSLILYMTIYASYFFNKSFRLLTCAVIGAEFGVMTVSTIAVLYIYLSRKKLSSDIET